MIKDFEVRYLSRESYEQEEKFSKDQIVFRLAGADFPERHDMKFPYRKFLDLYIIYFYVVSLTDESEECFLITDEIAEDHHLSEDELYRISFINTFRLFPLKVRKLRDELNEALGEDACLEDDANDFVYISGNTVNAFGASSILCTDMLEEMAGKLNSDLFLLPSSVHEFLLLPVNTGFQPHELQEMVYGVNVSMVADEEKLSDNVYVYRKGKLKIEMAGT